MKTKDSERTLESLFSEAERLILRVQKRLNVVRRDIRVIHRSFIKATK